MIKARGRKWEAKVYDRKRLGPDNPDDACRLRGKRIGRLNPDTWKELNVFIPPPSPPPFGSLLRRFAFNLCVCVCAFKKQKPEIEKEEERQHSKLL